MQQNNFKVLTIVLALIMTSLLSCNGGSSGNNKQIGVRVLNLSNRELSSIKFSISDSDQTINLAHQLGNTKLSNFVDLPSFNENISTINGELSLEVFDDTELTDSDISISAEVIADYTIAFYYDICSGFDFRVANSKCSTYIRPTIIQGSSSSIEGQTAVNFILVGRTFFYKYRGDSANIPFSIYSDVDLSYKITDASLKGPYPYFGSSPIHEKASFSSGYINLEPGTHYIKVEGSNIRSLGGTNPDFSLPLKFEVSGQLGLNVFLFLNEDNKLSAVTVE